ncbi:MAG: L,D-transpeptidase [Clostridia bacterium]|nr:L,D-transpeptidase [Clostridia bacterium]
MKKIFAVMICALMLAGCAAPVSAPAAEAEATPAPTAEPTPEPTPVQVEFPYYLYVEKGSYTLTIYKADDRGEYTEVVAAYRIAHGGNKTPAGIFTLGEKERWHNFPDGGTVQYATRYHERLYVHSPLYAREDASQLWPRYYDGDHGIGGSNTSGCLRMVTEASRFIYENCKEGTTLEIVNGSPKGTTSDPVPDRNGLRIDPTDVNMQEQLDAAAAERAAEEAEKLAEQAAEAAEAQATPVCDITPPPETAVEE